MIKSITYSGRKIEFDSSKINIIFGRTSDHTSDLLQGIAAEAFCDLDGYTMLKTPQDLKVAFYKSITKEDIIPSIKQCIQKSKKIPCDVDWDGSSVYYGVLNPINCDEKINDGLVVLKELNYSEVIAGNNLSDFKIYMINRALAEMQKHKLLKNMLTDYWDSHVKHYNDFWVKCYETQFEYFTSKISSDKNVNTFLLDGPDKYLDYELLIKFYKDVLPKVTKCSGSQVILTSESVFVLSEIICNPEIYNIISIDEDYTEYCKRSIPGLFK